MHLLLWQILLGGKVYLEKPLPLLESTGGKSFSAFSQVQNKQTNKPLFGNFGSWFLFFLCGLEKRCGWHGLNISTSKVKYPVHEAALMTSFALSLCYIRQP